MVTFALDARLENDSHFAADWPLSRLILMNDVRFPWLILVPRREGAVELTDLARADRLLLVEEMARAGNLLRALPAVAKLNFGALGNRVAQLHVHVVGRQEGDAAWPGPVWG
ncbi:MAG: HIT domain-containing protein, partial [Rhizomicrobium sp.]